MKHSIFFLFFVVATLCASAQNTLMATLYHEGDISVFYGVDAIKLAHDAAVDGDIISLTGGTYNATTLTKEVTLRGTGVFPNEDAQTLATRITGDFHININNSDTVHNLVIEGINFLNTFCNTNSIIGCLFKKCIFRTFELNYYGYSNRTLKLGTFINCYISELGTYGNSSANHQNTMSLVNCFVNNIYEANSNNYNVYSCDNCVIGLKRDYCTNDICYSSFNNCIFFGKENNCGKLGVTNSVVNCLATGPGMSAIFDNFQVTDNTIVEDITSIFKDFNGTNYADNMTFELTDEAARTYLCADGSQIGLYGGTVPFDFCMPALKLVKCVVSNQSTPDGKISVDLEVEGIK